MRFQPPVQIAPISGTSAPPLAAVEVASPLGSSGAGAKRGLAWGCALALGLVGLGANGMEIPLLGSVGGNFLFGNAAVLLAFAVLGLRGGWVAGLITWARFWPSLDPAGLTALLALLEAFGSWLIYRRTRSLTFSVVLYWLVPGWLLELGLYQGLLGLSREATLLIFTQQLLEGLINGLLAESALMASRSSAFRRFAGSPVRVLPLHQHIFRRLVLAVVLPAVVLAVVYLRGAFESQIQYARQEVSGEAAVLAARLEADALRNEAALDRLAGQIAQRLSSPRKVSDYGLEAFHRDHPEFFNLGLTDAAGRTIAASPRADQSGRSLIGFPLGERGYWQRARESGQTVYGSLVVGLLHLRSGGLEPVLPVAIAIQGIDGSFKGVLVASIDAERLAGFVHALDRPTQVTVLDNAGVVVVSNRPGLTTGLSSTDYLRGRLPDAAAGVFDLRDEGVSGQTPGGRTPRPAAVDSIVRTGWRVVVEMPAASVENRLSRRAAGVLLLLLPAAGLLYLVVHRLARVVADPILALGARARRLASDSAPVAPEKEAEVQTGNSPVEEIRDLASHFDRAATLLARRSEQAETALQRTVEQLDGAKRVASEADEYLHHLVQSVQVILWRADPRTLHFTFVSAEAESLLGYPCEHWVSQPDLWNNHIHPGDRAAAVSLCRAEAAAGRHHSLEYRMLTKDGRAVWLRHIARVVSREGEPYEIVGALVDITEQKETARVLDRTERELRELLTSAHALLVKVDQSLGGSSVVGRDAGNLLDQLGVMIDLRALKAAADADSDLRAQLERAAIEWERTFDAIPSMVLLVDENDMVVRANRAARPAFNLPDLPLPLSAASETEPWDSVARILAEMRETTEAVEKDAFSRTGQKTWAVTVSPLPRKSLEHEKPSAVVIARDVTQERLEAAHRAFLTKLWGLLAHASGLEDAAQIILEQLCEFLDWEMGQVYVLSPNRSHLKCLNVWYERHAGFESFHDVSRVTTFERGDGLVGTVWASGLPMLTNDFVGRANTERAEAARAVGINCMLGLPVRFGSEVVAVVELFRQHPQAGPLSMEVKTAAVAQLGSLIERYRAQAALAEHERSHRLLLANLSGMAYRCRNDEAWTMIYVSDGCVDLTGFSPEALTLGSPQFGDLIHPEDRDELWAKCQASLDAHRPCSNEYRIVTAAGAEKWVWDQAQGVYGASGELISIEGFVTDISGRKKAEADLQSANTMSAMGELVGGVAHEVRNPLFAISASIDAFEAMFGENQDYSEIITTLRGEVERLITLMNDLLDYGRPLSQDLTPGVLAPVVAQAVRACAGDARLKGVQLRNRVGAQLPSMRMDRQRLFQVFQNLVQNSIQHTPAGGQVDIDVHVEGEGSLRLIVCTVSDTGPGFGDLDIRRIFEPFFSRRRGGTGLGLAIVQRIVGEHKGTILARNRASRGAEMEIRFPAIAE